MDLGELHRREYGRILASLIRVVRDFSLAEDSLQEAFAAAHVQWAAGVPPNPVAWLMLTARNKAIDQIRRRELHRRKSEEISWIPATDDDAPIAHDTLRLIFTCCHPTLAPEAQVALTLHTVCGLETGQIARAFLIPETTLAQRLVRAKKRIKAARIPYEIPEDGALPERLASVLAVVYLVFNEGYSSSAPDESWIRSELCTEALRLGRQLVELLPSEREPKALLALMLFTDARRNARIDASGMPVPLEDQDRALWDRDKIEEGLALVQQVFRETAPPSSYALQSAIGAVHAQAATAKDTDWRRIATLYGLLARITPSPIVELNRAVAVAMAEGPEKGLALINKIALPSYQWLPAARADLLRRLGRTKEAAAAYREALALARNPTEKRFFEKRLSDLQME